jgi:hypothetical protein
MDPEQNKNQAPTRTSDAEVSPSANPNKIAKRVSLSVFILLFISWLIPNLSPIINNTDIQQVSIIIIWALFTGALIAGLGAGVVFLIVHSIIAVASKKNNMSSILLMATVSAILAAIGYFIQLLSLATNSGGALAGIGIVIIGPVVAILIGVGSFIVFSLGLFLISKSPANFLLTKPVYRLLLIVTLSVSLLALISRFPILFNW